MLFFQILINMWYVILLLDTLIDVMLANKQGRFYHTSLNETGMSDCHNPANICISEDVLNTYYVFIFTRRLQAELKTFWSRWMYLPCTYVLRTRCQEVLSHLDQDEYIRLGALSSRCLQYLFTLSLRRHAKKSSNHLRDVLPRHLQDVFKATSRRLVEMCSRV